MSSKPHSKIAEEIAGNNFFKTIFPGTEELLEELHQTINANSKMKTKLNQDTINDKIKTAIKETVSFSRQAGKEVDIDESTIEQFVKSMKNDYSDESFDKLSSMLQEKGLDKTYADATINRSKTNMKDVISREITDTDISPYQKPFIYPVAYFSNPDKHIRHTRINTAIGTYAGVSVGGRYLSGGTLTRDKYGRKDIAGIPFL